MKVSDASFVEYIVQGSIVMMIFSGPTLGKCPTEEYYVDVGSTFGMRKCSSTSCS